MSMAVVMAVVLIMPSLMVLVEKSFAYFGVWVEKRGRVFAAASFAFYVGGAFYHFVVFL